MTTAGLSYQCRVTLAPLGQWSGEGWGGGGGEGGKVRPRKERFVFSETGERSPHLPPAQPTAESITTRLQETEAAQHSKGTTCCVCV